MISTCGLIIKYTRGEVNVKLVCCRYSKCKTIYQVNVDKNWHEQDPGSWNSRKEVKTMDVHVINRDLEKISENFFSKPFLVVPVRFTTHQWNSGFDDIPNIHSKLGGGSKGSAKEDISSGPWFISRWELRQSHLFILSFLSKNSKFDSALKRVWSVLVTNAEIIQSHWCLMKWKWH